MMKTFHSLIAAVCVFAVSAVCSYAADHSYTAVPQKVPAKDTTSVLWLGNSFTFYFDCYNMLVEIAQSQGHHIKMKKSCVGGYTYDCHLSEPASLKAMDAWGNPYDYVILQNQSQMNACYARDPKRYKLAMSDAREIVARVRTGSPNAKILMEATWAYPGNSFGGFDSMEQFDAYMWKGTCAMAKATKCTVSPIGKAFAIFRAERPDIDLLGPDAKHQSKYGSYLKTFVDYLMIFGDDFDNRVSDCGIDAVTAACLRSAALKAYQVSD